MKTIVALWILLAAARLAAEGSTNAGATLSPVNYTDKSLYQVDSEWTTDAGAKTKLGALRGKPQVVIMFFASCQYACPLTIGDLKRIESALPETLRGRIGFTLISFDGEHDTPAVLHELRIKRELKGDQWTLLKGRPEDVRELAALLGVNYRKGVDGQFMHSNLITVLNSEGEIAFQQSGFNLPPDTVVAKLKTLAKEK